MFSIFEMVTLTLIGLVHVGSAPFYHHRPSASRWLLDFSSGLGLGYAFLYLLPKIGYMTVAVSTRVPDAHPLITQRLYLYMMLGFLVYYLVDFKGSSARPTRVGLVVNTIGFSIYNALVGGTIVHLNHSNALVYLVAALVFCLHLFGVNSFLIRMYPKYFARWMKWLFVLSVLLGAIAGGYTEKHGHYVSVATALVGGIIIILSVRLKLPARARVNVRSFLAGVATAASASVVYSLLGAF
ncbi:hypothetical protein [uncultured Shimia sp.]|uniref:hypothetical protein n=1 Tax=uncultured Shimia sp. TaxID=573152 RepID=UPI0025E86F1D|nr:hypothetical protein [uncultured Shimia sp.]